jgi:hypothetical protein
MPMTRLSLLSTLISAAAISALSTGAIAQTQRPMPVPAREAKVLILKPAVSQDAPRAAAAEVEAPVGAGDAASSDTEVSGDGVIPDTGVNAPLKSDSNIAFDGANTAPADGDPQAEAAVEAVKDVEAEQAQQAAEPGEAGEPGEKITVEDSAILPSTEDQGATRAPTMGLDCDKRPAECIDPIENTVAGPVLSEDPLDGDGESERVIAKP